MKPVFASASLLIVLAGCANSPPLTLDALKERFRTPESKSTESGGPAGSKEAGTGTGTSPQQPPRQAAVADSAVPASAAAPAKPPMPRAVTNASDPKKVVIAGLQNTHDFSDYGNFYALIADLRARAPGAQRVVSWNVITPLTRGFMQTRAATNASRSDAIARKEEATQIEAAQAKFRDSVIDTLGKSSLKIHPSFKFAFEPAKQNTATWYTDDRLAIVPEPVEPFTLNDAVGEAWSQQISKRLGIAVASSDLPKVKMNWTNGLRSDPRFNGLLLPATLEQAKGVRDALGTGSRLYVVVSQYTWTALNLSGLEMRLVPLGGTVVDESGKTIGSFGAATARVDARIEKPMQGACRKSESDYVSSFCPATTDAYRCLFAKKEEYQKMCMN